ncbi:MAG: 2-oxoisovalerate dehydrogenase E1 subunit beta [Phycisphaerales bacterium]|nr:MAG: 2-oxoisovalerate dehydrogenase E1 subunit beta [Phycisphaerales bacterium]
MPQNEIDEVVFIVEEEPEDGGYSASCSRWGIYTQGDNADDLRHMVVNAVECRFADEPIKPKQIRLHFVRDEVIAA